MLTDEKSRLQYVIIHCYLDKPTCAEIFWTKKSRGKLSVYTHRSWLEGHTNFSRTCRNLYIIIIYPLTAGECVCVCVWGGGAQIISQPVSSIFHCSPLPSGTWQLQACPFPDVVFPLLLLSALSSSHFHCALQDGFGQTWWMLTVAFWLAKTDGWLAARNCLFLIRFILYQSRCHLSGSLSLILLGYLAPACYHRTKTLSGYLTKVCYHWAKTLVGYLTKVCYHWVKTLSGYLTEVCHR